VAPRWVLQPDRQGFVVRLPVFRRCRSLRAGRRRLQSVLVVEAGREQQAVRVGGRDLTYRFFLDMGGAPGGVRQGNFLSSLKCISQAAR